MVKPACKIRDPATGQFFQLPRLPCLRSYPTQAAVPCVSPSVQLAICSHGQRVARPEQDLHGVDCDASSFTNPNLDLDSDSDSLHHRQPPVVAVNSLGLLAWINDNAPIRILSKTMGSVVIWQRSQFFKKLRFYCLAHSSYYSSSFCYSLLGSTLTMSSFAKALTLTALTASVTPGPRPSWPRLDFPQIHSEASSPAAAETTPEANAARALTPSSPCTLLGSRHVSLPRTRDHSLILKNHAFWNPRSTQMRKKQRRTCIGVKIVGPAPIWMTIRGRRGRT